MYLERLLRDFDNDLDLDLLVLTGETEARGEADLEATSKQCVIRQHIIRQLKLNTTKSNTSLTE